MHEAVQTTTAGGFVFWASTIIFILTYAAIISEKIHKTVAAIFGGALMIIIGILTQHEAFHVEELGVDWNVIFLLISMMVIINLMRPTGFLNTLQLKPPVLEKATQS